jgi:hypothetical protein
MRFFYSHFFEYEKKNVSSAFSNLGSKYTKKNFSRKYFHLFFILFFLRGLLPCNYIPIRYRTKTRF